MQIFAVLIKILLESKDFILNFAVPLIGYVLYICAVHSKELKKH